MSATLEPTGLSETAHVVRRARQAARRLAALSNERRKEALLTIARVLVERQSEILTANEKDAEAARRAVAQGTMTDAFLKRLVTSEQGVAEMAAKVGQVANLPDPLGRALAVTELDDDLTLYKESCPLGVIGVVFESRPDVVPQVAALALKSANAILLKGGSEAEHTNQALVSIWREVLFSLPEIPPDSINLLHTRQDVAELLTLDEEVDLIIPRGSREFVRYISSSSRIPVLGHGEGVCHVYVDRDANLEKALAVAFDSKVQYPAACNAMETLLVHKDIASAFLPEIIARLETAGVEVRGCQYTRMLVKSAQVLEAKEEDWAKEYSDLIVAIRVVGNLEEAIEHIQRYGSGHTEAIVTEQQQVATHFMDNIDAAGVFHNASTRFADGFRYGLGAELGISTGKLHARGPVGLEGLTTYKYKLFGNGHIVASYGNGERFFKHRSR